MSTNFPTSLDNLDASRGTGSNPLSTPSHVTHHTNEDDAIEAIQTKLGVNNSAVATTIDYLLKSTSSVSPGHKHVSAEITDLAPISSSTGVADGGKLIKTNFTGVLDESFVPFDYVKTLVYKSGVTTKTLSDANGTQTIAHGIGSAPQRVRIYGSVKFSTTSTGVITFVYDSASNNYVGMLYEESGDDNSITGSGIRLYGNANLSTYQNGVVTVDATNISIAWTKTGSPTVAWNLLWEAEGFTI